MSLKPAVEALRIKADGMISQVDVSVTQKDKSAIAPSGDLHDYVSLSRYAWPDPKDPKAPWIQVDGKSNEEGLKKYDNDRMGIMMRRVITFGRAFYFAGEERYASAAASQLRTWFIDPATRMNPHLNYAQFVPNKSMGNAWGIIDANQMPELLDAVGMLALSKTWTQDDHTALQAWCREYLTWLTTSKLGIAEKNAKNNHGTFYDTQLIALAMFVGDEALARKTLEDAKTVRIAVQIEPDGAQPLELSRHDAKMYACWNLRGFCDLATAGEKLGVDLWNFETADGRSIRKAVKWMLPFVRGERQFTYGKVPFKPGAPAEALLRAQAAYRDSGIQDAIGTHIFPGSTRGEWQARELFLLYPVLDAKQQNSALRGVYRYAQTDGPRLIASGADVQRAAEVIAKGKDRRAVERYELMLARLPEVTSKLRANYQREKPGFGFDARSMLLDIVISYRIAVAAAPLCGKPGADSLSTMRNEVIGATMDLVAALNKAGDKGAGYHVGQGSNMLPLAVAYDWLYDEFSPEQRKLIAKAMVDYSIKPTIDAMHKPDGRTFWVVQVNNWTTICLGGAIAGSLAMREADDPGPFEAFASDTSRVTRSLDTHFDDLLTTALPNLARSYDLLLANNGLWGEGPGYQHDAVLPLFLLIESLQTAAKDPSKLPSEITDFIARGKVAAAAHVNSSIHLASPLSRDFEYSDGTWPLTNQPINFLIADYAREAKSPLAQGAAWQTDRRGGKEDLGLHLLCRSRFDDIGTFDPQTLSKSIYFYSRRIDIAAGEPGANPHVVIWRQSFTDPNSTAVMFKGGDNRRDFHSHLDVGHFLFVNQGVQWTLHQDRPDGYPIYYRDGVKGWRWVTFFQSFPKRAASRNTLVINSAVNDYTNRYVPKEWLWQINPDQAIDDGQSFAWCPVENLQTDAAARVWTGTVSLLNAYARHGLKAKLHGAPRDPSRQFQFDRETGELTITDDLLFADTKRDNDAWWFMHLAENTTPILTEKNRIILADRRQDGTPVYLELSLQIADDIENSGLVFSRIEDNLPQGQPKDEVLWGFGNAAKMKNTSRKISVHLTGVKESAKIVVKLKPLTALAGKSAEEVIAGKR